MVHSFMHSYGDIFGGYFYGILFDASSSSRNNIPMRWNSTSVLYAMDCDGVHG